MKYEGYDKKRKSLRYSYKGTVHRIKIADDPRVFNEVARNSKKFKRLYNERTSVERYNGRIDRDYGMEKHSIRGLKKNEGRNKPDQYHNVSYGKSTYNERSEKLC